MRVLLATTVALLAAGVFAASDYDARRAADIKGCEAIDPSAAQSGLYLNPDGYRSFYLQSQCFQQAAVRFRDKALCANVRRRYSLLSSSWGYSASRCRTLVAEGVAGDTAELERLKRAYQAGSMTLRDFSIRRNGNGRDFDVIPSFAGTTKGGYRVTIEIVDAGRPPILLHSDGYYLDPESGIRIFIRRDDIRRAAPDIDQRPLRAVRATATLSLPIGRGDAYWSDAFIERVFPARERSQAVTRQIDFTVVP